MKTKENNFVKTIYILVFLALVVMLVGVSYAYITKKIRGGDNTRVIIQTADVLLKYEETNIIQSYDIIPGWNSDLHFSLENYSPDIFAKYKISLEIINPLTDTIENNFVYSLTSSTTNPDDILVNVSSKPVPIETSELGTAEISPNTIHNYTLNVKLIENGLDQNYLQGKLFIGKIKVETVYE